MIEPVLALSASIIKGLVKIMDRIETIRKTAHLRSHPIKSLGVWCSKMKQGRRSGASGSKKISADKNSPGHF
jgi:hypothetical protein